MVVEGNEVECEWWPDDDDVGGIVTEHMHFGGCTVERKSGQEFDFVPATITWWEA